MSNIEIKIVEKKNINLKSPIQYKNLGCNAEILYKNFKNNSISIKKISADNYIDLETGEIKFFNHIKNRSENILSVQKSIKNLREIINYNITDVSKVKWITLTYAENMTDSKRLYKDFEKFMKRLRYTFKQFDIDYIVAMEPQERGAWHAHLLLYFNENPGFIPNYIIATIWQQGFTKTKNIDSIDNIGAYLSAYLSNLDLQEYKNANEDVKHEIEMHFEGFKKTADKKYIKGGRLYMYPPQFNLYRCSRGIKKPIAEIMTYEEARKKIGPSAQPIFSKTINIKFNDFLNPLIVAREIYKKNITV